MPSLEFICATPDAAETRARLRSLRAIVRLIVGPTAGAELITALCNAEIDPAALPDVDAAFDQLATIPRRRILSTFAATLPQDVRP